MRSASLAKPTNDPDITPTKSKANNPTESLAKKAERAKHTAKITGEKRKGGAYINGYQLQKMQSTASKFFAK